MEFEFNEAIEILERTPRSLGEWLSGLSSQWLRCNEGEGTWSACEVVEHLIEAEHANWMPRLEIMLRDEGDRKFPPFDRYAHLNRGDGGTTDTDQRLREFAAVRLRNTARLKLLIRPGEDLERTGIHPEFGTVKLRELLSTWVVHDLTHISQIARTMAPRYREDVGPWKAYLGILKPRERV